MSAMASPSLCWGRISILLILFATSSQAELLVIMLVEFFDSFRSVRSLNQTPLQFSSCRSQFKRPEGMALEGGEPGFFPLHVHPRAAYGYEPWCCIKPQLRACHAARQGSRPVSHMTVALKTFLMIYKVMIVNGIYI